MAILLSEIVEHIGTNFYMGTVKAVSDAPNIAYVNSDPIRIQLLNVGQNHQRIVGLTLRIEITSQNPVQGNVVGVLNHEAAYMSFFN